jgi:hypothetical protein
MQCKRAVFALPALLFGLSPVFAQDAPAAPPVAVAPEPTVAPASVQFRLTPGKSVAYKMWLGLTGQMGAPGVDGGFPMSGSLNANANLVTDARGEDGSYPVRFQISDLKYTMNGAPAAPPDLPKTFTIAGTVGKDGAFVINQKASEDIGGSGLIPGPREMLETMLRAIVAIPNKPLVPGDAWKLEGPLPYDTSGRSRISMTNKVSSVETVNGDAVATVQRDVTGPFYLSISSPISVTMAGSIRGTGAVQVSGATGMPVDDVSTTTVKMTWGLPVPGGGEAQNLKDTQGEKSGKSAYTMDMEIKTHVTAVPAAAK